MRQRARTMSSLAVESKQTFEFARGHEATEENLIEHDPL